MPMIPVSTEVKSKFDQVQLQAQALLKEKLNQDQIVNHLIECWIEFGNEFIKKNKKE